MKSASSESFTFSKAETSNNTYMNEVEIGPSDMKIRLETEQAQLLNPSELLQIQGCVTTSRSGWWQTFLSHLPIGDIASRIAIAIEPPAP
jgi:hypothetical protein